MRFFLFDRVLELERGKRILATKSVSLMDTYLTERYTHCPLMPATLVIEGLAQAGGMLNLFNHDFGIRMVLMLIEEIQIRRQVRPGEMLRLAVQMLYDHSYGATVRGEARVGPEPVATVNRIVFAHEIVTEAAFVQKQRDRFHYQSGGFSLPEKID